MNAITSKMDCSLTDLDWKVVEMARSDSPRSLNPDTRFTRFLKDFFGLPITRTLANDRLEALRRFCVRAWHSDQIRDQDLRPLINAGYASGSVFEILAHVAGHRGFTPSLEQRST